MKQQIKLSWIHIQCKDNNGNISDFLKDDTGNILSPSFDDLGKLFDWMKTHDMIICYF